MLKPSRVLVPSADAVVVLIVPGVVNMKVVALTDIWLTILLGGFVRRTASKSTGLISAGPDFTVTIPKEGLPADRQEVFTLRPSGILRVIDETGKAVYMPQKSTGSADASQGTRTDADVGSSESYTAAYAFVNGKCDFMTEIQYKEAFPDYTAPLWIRTAYTVPKTEAPSSETAANFTLTNPPAEYLNDSVSFCVRFRTLLASGSNTSTATTSRPTQTSKDESKPSTGGAPEVQSPATPQPPSENSHINPVNDSQTNREEKHDKTSQPTENQLNGQAAPGARSPQPLQVQSNHADPPPRHDTPGDTVSGPDGNPGKKENYGITGGTPNDGSLESEKITAKPEDTQARRLSETDTKDAAYLTIVVHSAAWVFAGGIGSIPVSVLCITATLLSTL
ncbi:UNVERIFIED_CONTAM: Toxoplasma gondii family A protein [Hammondia hammondi]|eukprot:XP_008887079.1 Toxoplasma gondii family A protein [Hammondia hammondi]